MPNLGVMVPPQTRALQLPRHESLKAETRYNDDNTPYQVVRLYNAGSALTANRPYLVTFAGTAVTTENPRVTALADTGDTPACVVVAMEAVGATSWGWFAFQGYVECGVEGTTDVAAGDFLLVSAGVSTTGLVKDATTRSKRSCAIAMEAQASNAVVTTRVYLLGDLFSVSATETVSALSLGDGAVGTPSLSFTSDPDTGIYLKATAEIGFAVGGALQAWWASNLHQYNEGRNLGFGTSTGSKIGTGATQKIGFWNATPVVQPAAYTQTFSTADRTHAARTGTTLSMADGAGTNDNTIGAITADASVIAAFQEVVDEINKIIDDLADTASVVNSLVDDHQQTGLCA